MLIIAISGIAFGYLASKIDNLYILPSIVFACAFMFPSFLTFFQEIFAIYSYWIVLPIIIHFLLMELTVRYFEKNNT